MRGIAFRACWCHVFKSILGSYSQRLKKISEKVCFSFQKFSTSKNNVALCTPKFCKLPYARGSVKRELSGEIMTLYNSGKIPSCKIVCSLCVRISLSHHMPLYFLETSVLNNEGNKPFVSIFERGSVEIWRTNADQGIRFSS